MKASPALIKHLQKVLPIATAAALDAGKLIRKKFGKFESLSLKRDSSLVTEVDQNSERIIVGRLKNSFPFDDFIGEETGLSASAQRSPRGEVPFRWYIDPLDGTTNFVHKFPIFCVSIGLEFEESLPVLGVIHQPITGDLFTAYLGGGAFRNKRRMSVSGTTKLENALLTTGFSLKWDRYLQDEVSSFSRISRKIRGVRRTGSAALDLSYVATGQFDGFWERGLSAWDVAAGLAILLEAGGKFTQIDGKPYRLGQDQTLIASNGKLHSRLVATLR